MLCYFRDVSGAFLNIGILQEAKRCGLAWSVTTGAVRIDDRCHILVKRHGAKRSWAACNPFRRSVRSSRFRPIRVLASTCRAQEQDCHEAGQCSRSARRAPALGITGKHGPARLGVIPACFVLCCFQGQFCCELERSRFPGAAVILPGMLTRYPFPGILLLEAVSRKKRPNLHPASVNQDDQITA